MLIKAELHFVFVCQALFLLSSIQTLTCRLNKYSEIHVPI